MATLVSWFDTSRGRYLLVHEDSWRSPAPANATRLGTAWPRSCPKWTN